MVFGSSTLTTADLIRQTLTYVRGSARSPINVLAQNFAASQDQMVMENPVSGIQIGQAIEVDLSVYLVAGVNTATQTLTVVPQATADDHNAGARVTMRPAYDKLRVITEMNNELSDLSANDLYRPVVVEPDVDDVVAVPDGALVVLDVWTDEPSLRFVTSRQFPESAYRIVETPTGPELRGPATTIKLSFVTFGCEFIPLPLTDDTVNVTTTTGLWGSALDILSLGAAVRLLAGTEAQRNIVTHQGDTRRANEVPSGAVSSTLRNLAALRQGRLVGEAQRLRGRFGYTKRVGA